MTKVTKNKKQSKPASASRKSKKKGKARSRLFFRSWPSWWLWTGGIVAAIIYILVFYYFFVSPYSFRWRAYYGEPVFPDGYEVRGIDISHYQGKIEWDRVRNARMNGVPISFVIIKATEGLGLADECFQRNFMFARRNQIIRGAYHYFKPELDATKQARFFVQTAALEPGDLPPILDVEEIGHLSTAQLQQRVKVWLDYVEKALNVTPIIYTGRNFKTQYLGNKIFDRYPLWLAHYYVNEMSYSGNWIMWQHTDAGWVDGIKGKVDCNIFNGTMENLRAITIPED